MSEAKIKNLVDVIVDSYKKHDAIIKIEGRDQINKDVIIEIIEDLRKLIFAGFFGVKRLRAGGFEYYVGELLEQIDFNLGKQIQRAFRAKGESEEVIAAKSERILYDFLKSIPDVRAMLALDVEATFDGDPAASDTEEVIMSYPGLYAIMVYRLAHVLFKAGVPVIPRMMTEHAHSLTGIDIHPGATIGRYFFIDHGTGIVIGETCVIGEHVKIYQGVTLGALSTKGGQQLRGKRRHPTIEDNVIIYSGASVFGGDTVIEEGVVIGSNAFITSSVRNNKRLD